MNVKRKTSTTVATLAACIAFASSPALADRCGSGHRVDMPSCASYEYENRGSNAGFNVRNNCDYTVTFKVDVRNGRDIRRTLPPGRSNQGAIPRKGSFYQTRSISGIYCCPRYGRCGSLDDLPVAPEHSGNVPRPGGE